MGTASRQIVAHHDLTDTLDAFEDLYPLVRGEAIDHDHTGTAQTRPARTRGATREHTTTLG